MERWIGRLMLLVVPLAWYGLVLYQLSLTETRLDPVPAALWCPAGIVVALSALVMMGAGIMCCVWALLAGKDRRWAVMFPVTIAFGVTLAPVVIFAQLPWTADGSEFRALAVIYGLCAWIGIAIGFMKGPEKHDTGGSGSF